MTGISFLRDGEKDGKCSIVFLSADNQVLFSSHFVSGHVDLACSELLARISTLPAGSYKKSGTRITYSSAGWELSSLYSHTVCLGPNLSTEVSGVKSGCM